VFHDIGADIQETTLVFDWDERTLCDALSCVVAVGNIVYRVREP
jgi:hypothetical protein